LYTEPQGDRQNFLVWLSEKHEKLYHDLMAISRGYCNYLWSDATQGMFPSPSEDVDTDVSQVETRAGRPKMPTWNLEPMGMGGKRWMTRTLSSKSPKSVTESESSKG
jgi:hypothetical protein